MTLTPRPAEIRLDLTPGPLRDVGGWRDEHALPHRAKLTVYTLASDGPHPLGEMAVCDE